jgi:uncharacterized protein (DUF1810 family)
MSRLDRFKSAQASSDSGFESALAEIRSGTKRGHWIWYVFPQLAGLGVSPTSQHFGIAGEAEAVEFLRDPDLRSRFLTIAAAVADRLNARQPASLRVLMESDTDARKLVSSLTLFRHVAEKLHAAERQDVYAQIASVSGEVLSIAAREGYRPCEYTRKKLSMGNG